MYFEIWQLLVAAAVVLILFFVFFKLGIRYRLKIGEAKIGTAETRAREIIDESLRSANDQKREIILEAKEEALKTKNDMEKEVRERRAEVQRQENRIQQKEENLDNKIDALEKKENSLNQKTDELKKKIEETEQVRLQKLQELEKISGLTTEQAKTVLLQSVEEDVKHDMARIIKDNETAMKEESKRRAQEIVAEAIQRCAVDHVSETTISVISIPSDEMKGRIIGREGRNIRSFETITGVDLLIDDTPDAVVVSCFDPVRREIGRITLEKLIVDGRIHPARIEEMFDKATKEVEDRIRKEGEDAVFETNVHGLNADIVRHLGKLHYRTSYGQNVLKHSIEVSLLSGLMAAELGVDVRTAKRAGLLHDIGKSIDHEEGQEGSHVSLGVSLLKKYKENATVINAVEAHHGDVEPESLIACIVQAADAISAARPGARRETLENYVNRLEQLENIASDFKGVGKSFAIQAGREVRLMVVPQEVSDDDMPILAREVAKRIEEEMDYPGTIKINLIRETRVTETAK